MQEWRLEMMDLSKECFSLELPCYVTLGQLICRVLPTTSNIREKKNEGDASSVVPAGRLQLGTEDMDVRRAECCKGEAQFLAWWQA